MNYHNFAQKTNFIGGSEKFEDMVFYMTSVNIPGITFNLPEVGGRYSTKAFLASDKITYNNLNFEFLIDEDFSLYKDLMKTITKSYNPEEGTFKNEEFTFWLQINNNKGNKVMSFEFYNCRIENLGDINLNTQDDSTEHTMTLDIKYDYYKIVENPDMSFAQA